MKRKPSGLNLLIEAIRKLRPENGERQNVLTFIRSCYCGRVGDYDLDAALGALGRLTPREERALIAWVIQQDEVAAEGA